MDTPPDIAFGDRIRVLPSPETDSAGLSGLVGQVYGFTTPSVTEVNAIGGFDGDYAIVVHFDGHDDLWFHPRLLEFVDHASGTCVDIGGERRVRSATGEWVDPDTSAPRKPWWKLW